MSQMQPSQWLEWICSSKTPDELRDNYDQWASRYDADVSDIWNVVPTAGATMLAQHTSDKRHVVLDVGSGTGLTGAVLTSFGFQHLIGIDISPGMLKQAEAKGIYQSLVCCAIGDPEFDKIEPVESMIATGVFAKTHAGPTELTRLRAKLQPGGVLVFTARQSFLPVLQTTLEQPGWEKIDAKVLPIYDDPMHLLAYKANAN